MAILDTWLQREEPLRYERLYLPLGTLARAWGFLRENGALGMEQLCFLAGRPVLDGDTPSAQVTCCVLPLTSANAGYVTLSSHAQTALILDALEGRDEVPLMSLHTHADGGVGDCGPAHSQVDDHGVALTPEDGLFSGIVPYYALGSPLDFLRVASVYQRRHGKWSPLSREARARRIVVQDDAVRIVPAGAGAA